MIKNCQECNKIFAHPTMKICQSCYNKRNQDFAKVKEYLMKNRYATVAEVSQATEVSIERINEFIEEGRLKMRPVDVVLRCAICDKKIESGRLCNECSAQVKEGSKSVKKDEDESKQEIEERITGKIHLYDEIRGRRLK
ncbi:MAG: MerR family transcriptional regulator [Firmicutes bacterium]|nr:MerR family transcriptional regulator [Bacillota bacterium]